MPDWSSPLELEKDAGMFSKVSIQSQRAGKFTLFSCVGKSDACHVRNIYVGFFCMVDACELRLSTPCVDGNI